MCEINYYSPGRKEEGEGKEGGELGEGRDEKSTHSTPHLLPHQTFRGRGGRG